MPAEVLERTRTFSSEAIRYEISRRLSFDEFSRFRALQQSNRRRGEIMRHWGLGRATHVFNVLGEGGALLQAAREKGIPVLSDIIIALSTNRIEREEFEAFPDWGPAPVDLTACVEDGIDPTRHLLETTDIFVCPSMFVADDLERNWSVPRETIRVVPYALSAAWFTVQSRPRPGRILFVGSADRRKGVHYLAKAANLLRARGRCYEFRVAGGVYDVVRYHPEAATLNFLGRIPRVAITEEFAAADVFVLPSLAEGSATVVYEALAAGVPVVTTHAAGSVVRDGVEGHIVPERDPEALADAIESIVEDRIVRARMAQYAAETAHDFTWDNYRKRLCDLVKSL